MLLLPVIHPVLGRIPEHPTRSCGCCPGGLTAQGSGPQAPQDACSTLSFGEVQGPQTQTAPRGQLELSLGSSPPSGSQLTSASVSHPPPSPLTQQGLRTPPCLGTGTPDRLCPAGDTPSRQGWGDRREKGGDRHRRCGPRGAHLARPGPQGAACTSLQARPRPPSWGAGGAGGEARGWKEEPIAGQAEPRRSEGARLHRAGPRVKQSHVRRPNFAV